MHIRKIYSGFPAETREKWGDHVITGDVRVRKGRNSLNDLGVSVNEGFLKVYPALRNVIRSFPSLPLPLSPGLLFFSHPSLIFSVCPSFAPSAPSALLLVRFARSIQFTSSFFPAELESAPNKGRKRTSSSGKKELQPLEGWAGRRRGGKEGRIPFGKAQRGGTSPVLKASRVLWNFTISFLQTWTGTSRFRAILTFLPPPLSPSHLPPSLPHPCLSQIFISPSTRVSDFCPPPRATNPRKVT